jgi:hypothetical protein
MTYGAAAVDEERVAHATMADNQMVWDGSSPGHYEVWYLTLNHRPSKTGFWIRYTLESPKQGHGEAYAQLWFAAFFADDPRKNFALNRRIPMRELHAAGQPFAIEMGGARLVHDGCSGTIEGMGHSASWDLRWLPAARTHKWLPEAIYRTSFADTRVLSPNQDVPVRGTITVDGTTLELDGEPGGQTHIWGRKHAHEWAWGHCNAFDARRGVSLETLSARLKRRGVVLPTLTILTLYLDGEELRFTDFHDTILARGKFGTARYRFSAQGLYARVAGEYTCRPEDMILAEYSDPDGEPSWCANTEVADLRVQVWRRSLFGAWRRGESLTASGTGHFEVAGRTRDPAIPTRHETI